MKTSFTSKLLLMGNNTGIQVPEENIKELGTSKKPPVTVDVNGFKYKSTVAVMGGRYLISFPKAHREATGLSGGNDITVVLELDEGIREVEVPRELQSALDHSDLAVTFEKLAYSKRKEYARQVNDAKAEDTKTRRIQKIITELTQ